MIENTLVLNAITDNYSMSKTIKFDQCQLSKTPISRFKIISTQVIDILILPRYYNPILSSK